MLTLYFTLFAAGMLTILLPCILPLLPIVLGVSVTDRNRWRPLGTILGMVASFVGFTFLLQVALNQFVALADILQIGTYQVLFLFGIAFALHQRSLQLVLAAISGLFFWEKGMLAVLLAAAFGVIAMMAGGYIASRLQQFGSNLQQEARGRFGSSPFVSAFLIGLTLGLVWVPCAGPALGFALALVREQPGLQAFLYLLAYALGTAVPLLIVGYGGQWAVHSVRSVSAYSGRIKQVAGVLLILTAFALRFGWLTQLQTYLVQNTSYGNFANTLENGLFRPEGTSSSAASMHNSTLPKITRAPELAGLGPWHNSEPLTMAGLKGKVVLVDFWTYSCINCIRTLPYIQGYWEKYGSTTLTTSKEKPFVVLGVHSPEFTFEKSEKNVKDAIERHGLTYPIAQDNDFETWRAFANRYWPAKYLIDANGYIRYTHFGEGGYEETDNAIAALLAEAGVDVSGMPAVEEPAKPTSLGRGQSPETYLGSRSWPALGNAQGEPSEDIVDYKAPAQMKLHTYYLDGSWQLIDEEYQLLTGEAGEIRMKFLGGEANLVLGLEDGVKPVAAEVWIDGKKSSGFVIDRHDLFNLYKGSYGEHEMILKLKGRGVQGFAFTFGQ
jgi:cytochrome c biogenesis protein CcdA/thiol-disulfide isomerase/thioredoxin